MLPSGSGCEGTGSYAARQRRLVTPLPPCTVWQCQVGRDRHAAEPCVFQCAKQGV